MQDIVHQYGKTIIILTLMVSLFSLYFKGGGRESIYQKLSENLSFQEPSVSNTAELLSNSLFKASSMKICPKTNLKKDKAYRVKSLLSAAAGESAQPAGGKALQVFRLYDGPSEKNELKDLSYECIASAGKTVIFPSRGLYLLVISVRDDSSRNALQYLYIPIEGELS